jgi:hypothetical protein
MTHDPHQAFTSRARGILAAALALLTVSGCYWLFPDRGAREGLEAYPGQNPAATARYVRSLDFSVQDSIFSGPLECETPADCGNSAAVNIRIVPERRVVDVPIDDALRGNGNGHIVARIENLENKPFAPYGLGPNETAYLWAGALQSGARRIAIFRIDPRSGQSKLLATAANAGWCPGTNDGRKVPAVHINANPMCTERPIYSEPARSASAGRLASNSDEVVAYALSRAFSHARGLWFSCSLGCCEARGFEAEPM